MDKIFILGQILGAVTVILGFINYQVKTREQVLFVHIATTLCFAFHYMCLGAWAGMAMNFVGFVRNIVFYFVGKDGKVPKPWSIGFTALMVTMGLVSWEAWYSVLAVVGIGINSFAMSFSNPNNIRKSILITSPIVLVYDLFAKSYGGMTYESVVIISSAIGIYKEAQKNK